MKLTLKTGCAPLCLLILLTACRKNTPNGVAEPVVSLPAVVTGTPSNVTYQSAEFACFLSSQGSEPVTDMGICWDTLPEPTISKNKVSSNSGSTNFTCMLTGIKRKSAYPYYVRAYATSAAGTSYGQQYNFTPPGKWYPLSHNLSSKVTCMAYLGRLLAGTEKEGLFAMDLASEDWMSENLYVSEIKSLMFASSSELFVATSQGIYRKIGFSGWQSRNHGIESGNTIALANSGQNLAALADGQVYWCTPIMSSDWTRLNLPGISVSNIWEGGEGLVIFDKAAGKLHRSNIPGDLSASGTSPAAEILDVKLFDGVLYLGAPDGAYASKDKGATWTRVNDPDVDGKPVSCFVENRFGLCAAVGSDVYTVGASGDWQRLCPGLPGNGTVTKMCLAGSLYVYQWNGTSGIVYRLD